MSSKGRMRSLGKSYSKAAVACVAGICMWRLHLMYLECIYDFQLPGRTRNEDVPYSALTNSSFQYIKYVESKIISENGSSVCCPNPLLAAGIFIIKLTVHCCT